MRGRVLLGGVLVLLMAAVSPFAWADDPPTYAETQSRQVTPSNLIWYEGVDLDGEISHPPPMSMLDIKELMPYPPLEWPDKFPGAGAGAGVWYDAVTGETEEVPHRPPSIPTPMSGGGYEGALPGFDEEVQQETFNMMSQITNTQDVPWRRNVRLLIRFPDNGGGADHWGVCSGTMQDAEVVQTAGHCVYSHDPDITAWAAEIWVYPGWDGVGSYTSRPVEPYGFGRSTDFASWSGWVSGGDTDYDWGLISLSRGVGMLTGWFGWAWGGDCAYHQSQTYHNASYPSQDCPITGLHNGHDMYYWYGTIDACPGNQLQLYTGGGNCFDTVWGGMSGSGMYRIDGGSRYVHAICSTSNRFDRGQYCRISESWVNYMNNTFIPGSRGAAFDLQALDTNFEPATITAGQQTSLANFFTTNPTNGSDSGTWYFDIYLSTNDNISSLDTHLSRHSYTWTYNTMSSVRVNLPQPTIPLNTPSGTYWLGVEMDPATDGVPGNNDSDNWDATRITVNGVADLRADYINAPSGTYAPGEPFPVSYVATNIGGDPSTTVTVEVRASTNTDITVFDTLLGTFSHPGAVAGGTVSGTQSVSFPPSLVNRRYYIGMIVGSSDDVNPANNTDFDSIPLMKFDGVFYDGFESGDLSAWN